MLNTSDIFGTKEAEKRECCPTASTGRRTFLNNALNTEERQVDAIHDHLVHCDFMNQSSCDVNRKQQLEDNSLID